MTDSPAASMPPWLRACVVNCLAVLAVAAASAVAQAEEIAAIRDDNTLVTFDTASPGTTRSAKPLSGLPSGELIVGVDFRPSDGALFAVGNTSRLYRIQTDTGAVVPVGGQAFSPLLDGTDFGVTFDVTGATLRVTSDTGQNLVLDPVTGAVTSVDGTLKYAVGEPNAGATAGIVACGWSFSSQTGSALYGIDRARALLVTLESPSAGTVRVVGSLGVTGLVAGGFSSFDVSPDTNKAFAVLDSLNDTVSRLYSVNLATGAASQLGSALTALHRAAAVAPSSPPAPAGTRLAGLVAPADLVTFTTDGPQTVLRTVHLRGLPPGVSFLGIATRPATGMLYGLTQTGLYDIDTVGGTAERVGAGFAQPLASTQVACDFDPAIDRLRIVGDGGTNVRVNPTTGTIEQTDQSFGFAAGDLHQGDTAIVRSIAFTGRTSLGQPSKCFVLEGNNVLLARLGVTSAPDEARDGRLATIGPLSIDGVVALPLGQPMTATGDRTAYAAIQTTATSSALYHIDLTAGRAVFVAPIGTTGVVRGLTAEPTTDPPRVVVKKVALSFNFKTAGRDKLTLKGVMPSSVGSVAGKSITIDVGGLSKTFTLDATGRAKVLGDAIRIGGPAIGGIGLKLTLTKEPFVAALTDEQMDGTQFARRLPRQVVVSVTIDGQTYRATVDLAYTAKPGRSGSAVTH